MSRKSEEEEGVDLEEPEVVEIIRDSETLRIETNCEEDVALSLLTQAISHLTVWRYVFDEVEEEEYEEDEEE